LEFYENSLFIKDLLDERYQLRQGITVISD